MKQIILSLLAPVVIGGMFNSAFAQNEIDPCCNIIARDIQKNLVVARDHTTGRLYQFKTDALDIKAIKLNDAVNISAGKVSSISGAKRTYATVRPDPVEPCCGVVNIQPDPAEPCCSAVSFTNNTTNNTYTVSVPKQIAATLKTGQAVSIDEATGMAVVQSSYGNSNGQMNSYGYPATSGGGTTGNANATDKWVVTPVAAMKGVLGALDINFPAGVDRDIWIFQQADNKYVASVSKNAKSFPISPGTYRFTISEVSIENVPIKKGHITRLKSGFINIVSDGVWHINDETKEKQHTSGNKPRKVALPVGSYQLNLGGQFYPVIIKDGETVEY